MKVAYKNSLRNIGIDVIKRAGWGTHLCRFFKTKKDLLGILVPFFKAGLYNNESCIRVTSMPLGVEEAKHALRKVLLDYNHYLEKG